MNNCTSYSLFRNLIDAGYDKETAKKIELALQNGKKKEAMAMIEQHRKELLAEVHIGEKCISCLDYLVYKLNDDKEK